MPWFIVLGFLVFTVYLLICLRRAGARLAQLRMQHTIQLRALQTYHPLHSFNGQMVTLFLYDPLVGAALIELEDGLLVTVDAPLEEHDDFVSEYSDQAKVFLIQNGQFVPV
jgi:hypothetical protein